MAGWGEHRWLVCSRGGLRSSRPFLTCCSCGLGVGCSCYQASALIRRATLYSAALEVAREGPGSHSQIIAAADDPILARNKATRPYGDVCQLERLHGGLRFVAPYINVAAVEGGEDPWLFAAACQLCARLSLSVASSIVVCPGNRGILSGDCVPRSGESRCPLHVRSGHFAEVSCQFLVQRSASRRARRVLYVQELSLSVERSVVSTHLDRVAFGRSACSRCCCWQGKAMVKLASPAVSCLAPVFPSLAAFRGNKGMGEWELKRTFTSSFILEDLNWSLGLSRYQSIKFALSRPKVRGCRRWGLGLVVADAPTLEVGPFCAC